MSVYAVGDVQGCLEPLQALLARLRFDPRRDYLWFTGDLVNRGPRSLEVLRFVRDLGDRAITVLGNHDLHLLAVASGLAKEKKRDTLSDILQAPDRDSLLAWLSARPLLHRDESLGYTLVHAGLLPEWDMGTAQRLAREAEAVLRGNRVKEFFAHMYGDLPDHWIEDLQGFDRWRVIVNAFTRIRYCDLEGHIDLRCKVAPGQQPPDLVPWYAMPGRRSRGARIVVGHWSTLGAVERDGVFALDSGCLWGGALTALRLDASVPEWVKVPCTQQQRPDHV